MHEVILSRPQDNKRDTPKLEHLHGTVDAFMASAGQHVKVYRTYVLRGGRGIHVFMTTSKDVHLTLGALDQGGLFHLAELLREEFVEEGCNQLLFFPDSKYEKGGLLITVESKSDDGWCFHLSPAH